MPCVTAHYFHRELQQAVDVPVLNGVADTAALLKAAGVARAGILATAGTIRSRLLSKALEGAGIEPVLPSAQSQEAVMGLIYESVKGQKPVDRERFRSLCRELMDGGSEVIILGCTELSLIPREVPGEGRFLDMLDVMAREAVLRCGKRLKPQYRDLLEGGSRGADQYSGIPGGDRRTSAG